MYILCAVWPPSEELCLFVEIRRQQKGRTVENEKLRKLHRGKIDLPHEIR